MVAAEELGFYVMSSSVVSVTMFLSYDKQEQRVKKETVAVHCNVGCLQEEGSWVCVVENALGRL